MSPFADKSSDQRQRSDVKFAEADAAPELRVSGAENDGEANEKQPQLGLVPNQTVCQPESSPQVKTPQVDPLVQQSARPESAATRMPRFFVPVIAIGLFYVFGSIAFAVFTKDHFSLTPVSISLLAAATASLGAHGFWLVKALKSLEARTANFANSSARGKLNLALTALMPIAWYGLCVANMNQFLYATQSPALHFAPWLIFASYLWWNWNLFKEQFALLLKSRLDRLSALKYKNMSFDDRAGDALGESIGYATIFFCSLTTPFFGALFPILRTNSVLKRWENAKQQKEQASKRNPNVLEIRYRSFAGLERWVQQRIRGSRDDRVKNAGLALVSSVVMMTIGAGVVWANWTQLLHWWVNLSASATASGYTATPVQLANIAMIRGFGLLGLAAMLMAYFVARRQPTHYRFTPDGFYGLRRWSGDEKPLRLKVDWKEVQEVQLLRNKKKTQFSDMQLVFKRAKGSDVRLKLGSIEAFSDREAILAAIEKWAPHIARDAEVVQALQPPVDQSYTEMWLQALSAPPRRDRLKPLEENVVLGEGRYRVRRSLGVGGQGAAYEAYDTVAEELVVLKEFLLPIYVDMSVRKEVLERFEGEARILKNLSHDQIVKLSDFFIEDHRAYLVLEHIDGLSLRQLVNKEGPLGEDKVKELSKQMCTMLTYLHEQSPPVVHRDFTPDNLILRHDGKLKLIDFNVARQIESTVTSSVVGKPSYLPPEQFRGAPVPQSDIYGMGATLNFLLTGKDPEPISVSHPRTSNQRVTKNMDELVSRATAMDVKNRFQNCQQILEALSYEITEAADNQTPAQNANETSSQLDSENIKLHEESRSDRSPELRPTEESRRATLKESEEKEKVELKEQAPESSLSRVETKDKREPDTAPASETAPPIDTAGRKNRSTSEIGFLMIAAATIAVSAMSNFVPDSVFWGDPKAELHMHERDGEIDLIRQDYEKAIKEFDRCIQIDANDANAHNGKATALATVLPHHNDLIAEEAITEASKAAQIEPDNKSYQAYRAKLLLYARHYSEAKEAALAALKAHALGFPPERNFFMATSQGCLNRIVRTQILAACDLHLGDGAGADSLMRGQYGDYGKWMLAQELTFHPQAAYQWAGQNFEATRRETLFAAHYTTLGRISTALEHRSSTTTDKQAYDLCLQGMAYNALGQYNESLSKLDAAAQLKPSFTDTYLYRASTLWYLNKNDAALQDVEKVLQVDSANFYAHYLHGRILMQVKQYTEAKTEFDFILLNLKDYPSQATLRAEAHCLAMLGQYKKAELESGRLYSFDDKEILKIDYLHRAGKDESALEQINKFIDQRGPFYWHDQYPYYLRARINESLGHTQAAAQDKAKYESMGYSFDHPVLPDVVSGDPGVNDDQVEGAIWNQ